MVLEIRNPGGTTVADKVIDARVDALLRVAGVLPLNSVAETIFPAKEYRLHGAKGVYDVYPETVFPKIRPLLNWGTYAQRLLRRRGRDGKPMNPLKICVEKMKGQLAKEKGAKRNCYELSLNEDESDEPLELAIYTAVNDQKPTFGRPCLSHISLKITRDGKLNLSALYRSHYYVERALGNLLGLARLQDFICKQTGLAAGTLVCLATYARLDVHVGWGKTKIEALLDELGTQEAA
jgi:hypothetical protein